MDKTISQQMTELYLENIVDTLTDEEHLTEETYACIATLMSVLLPYFAVHSVSNEHPEFTAKQLMVHVGNRAVVSAIEGMDEEFLTSLEEMR